MWSRSSPTRQSPFRAVSTSTRCLSACRSPAVFAATGSSWTRPRRWNRPLPTSQGSDARAPTLTSSLGLRSTSNRSRPIRPYRPRPPNADLQWSSSPASSELDLDRLALVRARCSRRRPKASTQVAETCRRLHGCARKTDKPRVNVDNFPAAEAGMGRQYWYNGRRSGLLMPTVPDPDLVPFEPPDHPTIRAAFRNVIESYPRALYDGQGLVRYRTRFLDSVLVSEPELIHDILVARADLFRRDDVARQLLSPMLGPTSLFMAEGADWRWQRRAVAPTFRHDKLLALVPTFSAIAVRQADRWRAAPRERPVDVAEAMAQTTCEVIVDTMLGSAGALDVRGFARALTTELDSFPWRFILTSFRAPSWLPYPGRRSAARAREHIYREAARLVAQRRQGSAARGDLLGLLVEGLGGGT